MIDMGDELRPDGNASWTGYGLSACTVRRSFLYADRAGVIIATVQRNVHMKRGIELSEPTNPSTQPHSRVRKATKSDSGDGDQKKVRLISLPKLKF